MRHEVAGHTVVRVVEEDSQSFSRLKTNRSRQLGADLERNRMGVPEILLSEQVKARYQHSSLTWAGRLYQKRTLAYIPEG